MSEEEKDTLRDDLEAAFDGDDAESEATTEEAPQEEPAEESAEVPEDTGEPEAAADPGSESSEVPEQSKAPLDWGPELRESWGALPDGVKEQITRREQQIAQAMHGTAQARQLSTEMQNLASSFGSVMTADGFQNPMQAVQNYVQTAAQLRMGTPTEKATKIAELIKHYGVDIQTLDSTLAGEAPQDPQISQMEQLLDQRLGPVNQLMQNLAGQQLQRQQMSQQQAAQEVQQFSQKAEFLNDVRHQMADMLDLAAQQGRQMSMEEAYNLACQVNPGIKAVLDKRAQQQSLLPKKAAASSVVGQGASGGSAPSTDLHSLLNEAWDAQTG